MMPAVSTPAPEASPSRRRTITTILLIMLFIMIIRDIFMRRWGAH